MAPQASLAKIGKEGFDIIDKFFGKHSHRAQQQISHQNYLPQDSYTHYAPQEAYIAKAYYSAPQEAQPARATKAYYPAPHEAQPARVTKAYYPPPEATTVGGYHYYERTTQSVEYQKPVFRAAFN